MLHMGYMREWGQYATHGLHGGRRGNMLHMGLHEGRGILGWNGQALG